jgi:hypothetical protein
VKVSFSTATPAASELTPVQGGGGRLVVVVGAGTVVVVGGAVGAFAVTERVVGVALPFVEVCPQAASRAVPAARRTAA